MNRREFSATGLMAFLLAPLKGQALEPEKKPTEKGFIDLLWIKEGLPCLRVIVKESKNKRGLENVRIVAVTEVKNRDQSDKLVEALKQWRVDWLKYASPFDKKKHGYLQPGFTVTEEYGATGFTVSVSYSYIRLTGRI